MANETDATPPAANAPAAKGDVKLRTRPGFNYHDGDFKVNDGEVVTVSAEVARKYLVKAPDYLVVVDEVPEEKE